MSAHGGNRARYLCLTTLVGGMLALAPTPSRANTITWTAPGGGNWSNAGNWSAGGPPGTGVGDTANIYAGGITVTYDVATATIDTMNLGLPGYTGSNTNTLTIPANSLTATNEYVGTTNTLQLGSGTINQNGGSNSIVAGGELGLGLTAGAVTSDHGFYNLSGGSLTTSSNAIEAVGDGGIGTFVQSGGTNSAPGAFGVILGRQGTGVGTYTLNGTGSLAADIEVIGYAGTGTFNQSAGVNTIGNSGLYMGRNSGSTGQYNLSGTGSLVSNDGEFLGGGGTGVFTQTGGTNTITVFGLGIGGPGNGSYNLSGGSVSALSGGVGLGLGGAVAGTLTVSGTGVLTASMIEVDNLSSSVNLQAGGTINTAALNFNGSPSLLNWTGGTLNLTSNVTFDSAAAGTSTSNAFGPSLTLGNGQTLQITGNETLGGTGSFSLTLNNGSTHIVTGNITLNPTGILTQNAGSTLSYITFTQAGGTVNGTLQNQGTFVYQSGQFNGRLQNQGIVNLGPHFTAGNGIENDASMTVSAGQLLTVNGAGLDNLGTLTLSGGTINGASLLNDAGGQMLVSGATTVNTSFTNLGQMSVGGALTLSSGGTNSGIVTLQAGGSIRGGAFNNGSGGVVQGNGAITASFANNAGGSVLAASGNSLNIGNAWTNAGLVTMQGGILGPGTITNTSLIQGAGLIGGHVANTTGVIQAVGGQLNIAGSGSTNGATGQIQAPAGGTVLFLQGLATNAGTIALSGGIFDNGNVAMTNTGSILGAGTLKTGGLTNQGSIDFADLPTSVFGSLTTDHSTGGGNVQITNDTTTFFGPVTVGASTTFHVTKATARFLSSFTNNGIFITDPTTSTFTDLNVGPGGAQVGSAGDIYQISGDFNNHSTLNTVFDLSQVLVQFLGGGNHNLVWPGTDDGPLASGYTNNFALGTLELEAGNSFTLSDGSGLVRTSAGLYVGTLLLDGQTSDSLAALQTFILTNLVNSSLTDVLNIYYDPSQSGNLYLNDLAYALGNGGFLRPIPEAPEPSSAAMMLLVTAGIWLRRRYRRQHP